MDEDDWTDDTPSAFTRLSRVFGDIAGAVLVGMMLLTVYDIVARTLGLGSVEAVVELTTMGVVIVASFGLAITTIKCGHVIIDLFTRHNRRETNRFLDAIWLIVMAGLLAVIGYLTLIEGILLHSENRTTEVLKWSVLALYVPPVVGWALAVVITLWIGVMVVARRGH